MSDEGRSVLVIGAGVAGMEASLMLSQAGIKVHLVERKPYIGGTSVLLEEVFPTLECATCMLSPRQQEILQDANIDLLVLSEVESIAGSSGHYHVKVRKKASYVDPGACIGCGACFEPCPVEMVNEEEMGLAKRKAISIPFAGSLPNVPAIDKDGCLHLKGGPCQACKDACVFAAIDFEQKDVVLELEVSAIVVATGLAAMDLRDVEKLGYGAYPEVYTSLEFERLRSSNGPSQGAIVHKDGTPPRSVALVHCAGRSSRGYCSSVCCMYLAKFNHYLRSKVPGVEIHEFYTDLCIPGPGHQRFFMRMMEGGTDLVRFRDLRVEEEGGSLKVLAKGSDGDWRRVDVDMVVLAPALEPREHADRLAQVLGIAIDGTGFFASSAENPVASSRDGIYIIGGVRGPMSIEASVSDALAAVAEVLAERQEG